MNCTKYILSFVILYSSAAYALDQGWSIDQEWHEVIENNLGKRKVLATILVKMSWLIAPQYDITAAKRILDMGISPNVIVKGDIMQDSPGSVALTQAASYEHTTEYVKLLLDYGANIETKCPWNGFTALMKASMYGYNDTVTELINRGAHVHAHTQVGSDGDISTPLTLAAEYGHVETAQLLFKAGAYMRIAHPKGKTLIHVVKKTTFIEEQNRENVVQLLKTRIIDQAEGTIVLARAYALPLDLWKCIIAHLDLEDVHMNKLIHYLTVESSIKKS